MFKLYSKGCQYALRALVLFVAQPGAGRFRAAEVCKALDVPEPFTRKVFQQLANAGFLEAHRGPNGGYALVRDPKEITLLQVIQAVEGPDTFNHCVMGFEECSGANPCPLHNVWLASKQDLLENLSTTTLHDLSASLRKRQAAAKKGTAKPRA